MPVDDISDDTLHELCSVLQLGSRILNTIRGDMEGDLNRYKEEYISDIDLYVNRLGVVLQKIYNAHGSED